MATTTSPSLAQQHAPPVVTREQIEATIRSLQPFERVMIRLLMLQYLDPTHDDVTFMARERSEPNMKAGHKFGGFAVGTDRKIILPREWITAIEHKVQELKQADAPQGRRPQDAIDARNRWIRVIAALETALAMRHELAMLWERSSASKEQLVRQLQDWCRRAEGSGVAPLVAFSQRLRSYALA